MQKKKHQAGFGVVEVIVIVTILVLVGIGGWYIWQAQQKSPESGEQSQQQSTQNEPTPEKTTLTFNDSRVPFTFEYPKDWTVNVDSRLVNGQPLPDQYSIELLAPGTVLAEQPMGGSFVTKGARVLVWDSKTTLTNIQDRFTGIYSGAKNRVNKTVAGLPAVEYEFAYESDPGVYTELVKGGRLYSVSYTSADNDRNASSHSEFLSLVASFKFK